MKIAVLTSGGDSAGMNAAVRSVVKAGILWYVLCLEAIWIHLLMGPEPALTPAAVTPGSFAKAMKVSSSAIPKKPTIETPIRLIFPEKLWIHPYSIFRLLST